MSTIQSGQKGFTLIELVIVVVLLGLLGAYVTATNDNSAPELSVPSQAEALASNIRRYIQAVANRWS